MQNLALFPNIASFDTRTEGIKYTGSKSKLLPYILKFARSIDAKSVLDGFSGSTRVSQAFAKNGFKVIANDSAVWSRVFAECYLSQHKNQKYYVELIDHLNALPVRDGWFTEHYGGHPNGGNAVQSDGCKKPWQIKNTRKLDAVREEIDVLDLDRVTRAVVLTSLILAMDKVDNTLGHYVSYLREWSPRSYNDMVLKLPVLFDNTVRHEISQKDIFEISDTAEVDLAYFDPPYGSSNEKMPPSRVRYAAYYHLWKTICLNDKPALFGKARRRRDSSDRTAGSIFEEFRKNNKGKFIAIEAIEKLIRASIAPYILLSYSSGGRATARELVEVMRGVGDLEQVVELDYKKNVMAGMKWTQQWVPDIDKPHREFLFLLKKK